MIGMDAYRFHVFYFELQHLGRVAVCSGRWGSWRKARSSLIRHIRGEKHVQHGTANVIRELIYSVLVTGLSVATQMNKKGPGGKPARL